MKECNKKYLDYRLIKSKRPSDVNLVMFPFAGGSCLSYNALVSYLLETVNIILINPLGHYVDKRPLADSIERMAEHYLSFLPQIQTKKTFFWGHSLGGLVVFEILKQLVGEKSAYLPSGIFLSAIQAPSVKTIVDISTESELLKYASENGLIDEELLNNSTLTKLILPALMADFKSVFSYNKHQPSVNYKGKVSYFYSDKDPFVDSSKIELWNDYFPTSIHYEAFNGDHMYFNDIPLVVSNKIIEKIKEYIDA